MHPRVHIKLDGWTCIRCVRDGLNNPWRSYRAGEPLNSALSEDVKGGHPFVTLWVTLIPIHFEDVDSKSQKLC